MTVSEMKKGDLVRTKKDTYPGSRKEQRYLVLYSFDRTFPSASNPNRRVARATFCEGVEYIVVRSVGSGVVTMFDIEELEVTS
jgi:hypothetical protein